MTSWSPRLPMSVLRIVLLDASNPSSSKCWLMWSVSVCYPFVLCVSLRCVCCYSFSLLCFVCCVTSAPTVKDAKKGAKLAMGALSRFGSKAGLDFTGKASRASMSSLVAPLAAAAPTKPPPHVRGFLYKKGFTGLKKWQVINKALVGCQVFLTVMCVLPLSLMTAPLLCVSQELHVVLAQQGGV